MLKDITLGQYFPGDTVIHRTDPRVKIVLTTLFILLLFMARGWASYGFVLLLILACVAASKLKPGVILKGLKPLMVIIALTGVLNLFYTKTGPLLLDLGILQVYAGGVQSAVFMVARIIMLVTGTLMLTYTTSPVDITDALERLLGFLKTLRVPVHELAMMMSIALRFIPTLIEETDKIMSAQKARGADFESGRLTQRAKALIPLLVPLFVSAFRRADELAMAMESRGYHGGEGRTRMKVLKLGKIDAAALTLAALAAAAVAVLNRIGL